MAEWLRRGLQIIDQARTSLHFPHFQALLLPRFSAGLRVGLRKILGLRRMLVALPIACLAISCTPLPEPEPIAGACSVTDGDTIRCGDERIRLLGIDAPELGQCPRWRDCVEGDGNAARAVLQQMLRGRTLTIVRLGEDRYGRTLGVVYADGRNTSCAMLEARQAEYVGRWDNGGMVARDCHQLTGNS